MVPVLCPKVRPWHHCADDKGIIDCAAQAHADICVARSFRFRMSLVVSRVDHTFGLLMVYLV